MNAKHFEINDFEIKEIAAKSILVSSKLPECDFVINPYVGCRFGCSYCYASFMGRLVDKKRTDWGGYVFAKTNAPELLTKEITRLKDKGKNTTILLSSVTDPFQGVEAKYHLSQKCLEVLADYGFEGNVSILTKSPLVIKAIPTLKRLRNVEVGLTITATDDAISRYFEKYAPNVSQRLETLRKLNEAGIRTYAFFGPLLPHFVTNKEEIRKVLAAIHETGTRRLFIEHINLAPYIKERMLKEVKNTDPKFLEKFYASQSEDYRNELNKILLELLKEYDFELLHEIIFHKEDTKARKDNSKLH